MHQLIIIFIAFVASSFYFDLILQLEFFWRLSPVTNYCRNNPHLLQISPEIFSVPLMEIIHFVL